MNATELRARILEDHEMLRGKADVLEELALRILRGDEDLDSALRLKGEEIRELLIRHIDWEETELVPSLREISNNGIADQISTEHEAQRKRIAETFTTLQNSERRPVELARYIVDFVRVLETDMRDEEASVLSRHLGPPEPPAA